MSRVLTSNTAFRTPKFHKRTLTIPCGADGRVTQNLDIVYTGGVDCATQATNQTADNKLLRITTKRILKILFLNSSSSLVKINLSMYLLNNNT